MELNGKLWHNPRLILEKGRISVQSKSKDRVIGLMLRIDF
jgi:hypothetical protein